MKSLQRFFRSARAAGTSLVYRAVRVIKNWHALEQHRPERDQALLLSLRARATPTAHQWRHLPMTLGRRGKIAFSFFTVCFFWGVAILVREAFTSLRVPVPARGGIYTEAVPGTPKLLNPIVSVSQVDADLTAFLYAPLFRVMPGRGLTPALAASFEISRDSREITIKLRTDALWHDGKPVTAKDVVYTIRRIQDPDWRSPRAGAWVGVNARAVDNQTVRLTLPAPSAPFFSNLDLPVIPEHVWSSVTSSTVRTDPRELSPVGSGPFQFEEIKKDAHGAVRSITLARNENYFENAAYLDEIIFKFFADEESAIASLLRRGADGVGFIPASAYARVGRSPDINLVSYELPQYTALFWNTQGREAFRDIKLRAALVGAVDRARILDQAFGGLGALVESPFPQLPAKSGQASFDPVTASETLDALGWVVSPPETVRRKNSIALEFTLTTVDDPAFVRAAEIIKSNLELVGARVILDIVPAAKIRSERIATRGYDAILIGEVVGADPDPYAFWHSSQVEDPGVNLSKYQNREVDRLIEEARTTIDAGKRAELYGQVADKIRGDAPAIFLLSQPYVSAYATRVHGVTGGTIVSPSDRLRDAASWYVKEKKVWRWKK